MADTKQPIVDKKAVLKAAQDALKKLDELQPHINQAQSGFGGFDDHIAQANDLRNRLNKVIAAYSQ